MADGKKKRSLREAFGMVSPPEETAQTMSGGDPTAGPVGAPAGGKPAQAAEEKSEKLASRKRRTNSSGNGSNAVSRLRRNAKEDANGDPVITGKKAGMQSEGQGRASSAGKGQQEAGEMVPGKGGKMVPAETPVNMTFTVTAKERYLWTLELKRRGLTAVGVLRETMEEMVGEEQK